MTPDELRALADCLDDQNAMQRTARRKAADFLRACADAQPVAWMHDGFMSTDYERVQHDEMRNRSCGFKAKPIIPLYTHPAPAAPQAEPETFESELRSFAQTPEQAEFVEKVLAAEPKREPLSDERIDEIQRAAYERAAQECEPHDDDDSIDRQIKRELAERILALGRQ